VILADTSSWVSLAAARDANHAAAITLWGEQRRPVLVTNHVAGETWTFLRRGGGHAAAMAALEVFRSRRVELAHVEPAVEEEAWRWLQRHDERSYSFVDAPASPPCAGYGSPRRSPSTGTSRRRGSSS
jgi:predicted nucleic acid-binding protein